MYNGTMPIAGSVIIGLPGEMLAITEWNRGARNLSTDVHGMALCRLIRD